MTTQKIQHYKAALRAIPCCRLLVMNIVERGEAWGKLCPFLNVPRPLRRSFPYFNPRDTSTITRRLPTDAENSRVILPGSSDSAAALQQRPKAAALMRRISSSTKPSTSEIAAAQTQTQTRDELPAGWHELKTPERRVYYESHILKSTQWERPRTAAS